MSIRIINNFKLMVLRAQTELGALLWICFTPKYMLLIFVRFFLIYLFFRRKFFRFFFAQDFFSTKKSENVFPTKNLGRKKNLIFFSKKIKSIDLGAVFFFWFSAYLKFLRVDLEINVFWDFFSLKRRAAENLKVFYHYK